MALRTSAARFHRPEAVTTSARTERLRNGVRAHARGWGGLGGLCVRGADVCVRAEGLDPAAKMSAILGYGGGDLPSHGVADNFAFVLARGRCARGRRELA